MKKVTLLFMLLITMFSAVSFADNEEFDFISYSEKAIIIFVDNQGSDPTEVYDMEQKVVLKVTSGEYKGEIFEISNFLSGSYVYDIPVKKDDKVIVQIEKYTDGSLVVNVTDHVRDTYIYLLVALFFVSLILVGKIKGFKTVITIVFTMLMIFKVLLPLFLKGYNPIILTVLVAILIAVFTILFVSGVNKKSAAAIIGTMLGVVIAGFLAFLVGSKVKLTGLSSEEAAMLLFIPQDVEFNFKELLFSGILLGSLGAVMDVAMSIASSIEEIHKADPKRSMGKLFNSGMEIGKDIMGTMSNTLILAYTGSSIPLLLIFMSYD
ncbi:MAG: YibE/F family protein, partial [Acidaminobacteraceae bacterium]